MRKIANRFSFCHLKRAEIRSFALLLVAWTFIASVQSADGGSLSRDNIRPMQKNNRNDDKIPKGRFAKRMKGPELQVPLYVYSTFVFNDSSRLSYGDAEKACQKNVRYFETRGRLATVTSLARDHIFVDLDVKDRWEQRVSWVGALRTNRYDPFHWVTGETMTPSTLRYDDIHNLRNCISIYRSPIDNDIGSLSHHDACHDELPFVCELDARQANHPTPNPHIHQLTLLSQFMIVLLPHTEYLEALDFCRENITAFAGGRLSGPTTLREMATLDEEFEKNNLTGRWWLGATKLGLRGEKFYDNGDAIPRNLRPWLWSPDGDNQLKSKNCLIYDNLAKMLGWEDCHRPGKPVDGFVCQHDLVE